MTHLYVQWLIHVWHESSICDMTPSCMNHLYLIWIVRAPPLFSLCVLTLFTHHSHSIRNLSTHPCSCVCICTHTHACVYIHRYEYIALSSKGACKIRVYIEAHSLVQTYEFAQFWIEAWLERSIRVYIRTHMCECMYKYGNIGITKKKAPF